MNIIATRKLPLAGRGPFNFFTLAFVFFVTGAFAQPDLIVDLNYLKNNMVIDGGYNAELCEFEEGCVGAAGIVKALRFGTRSMNIGDQDLIMGNPADNPEMFEWHPCHNHYHFGTFANYELFDLNCNSLGLGHKLGFCLMNSETVDGSPRSCSNCSQLLECGGYNCIFQGLGAGCADVYSRFLDCQLLDITNIPSGKYYFKITLNFARELPESNYTNNSIYMLIQINGHNLTIHYADYAAPDDRLVEDLDNKTPPNNQLPAYTVVTDNLEITGLTTINDFTSREIIASHSININPDSGPVKISASLGGSTHMSMAHCLAWDHPVNSAVGHFHSPADGPVEIIDNREDYIDLQLMEELPAAADLLVERSIKVFPNPTQMGRFSISLPIAGEEKVNIQIHDANGKLVRKKEVTGLTEVSFNLSDEASGIYSVMVMTQSDIFRELIANF